MLGRITLVILTCCLSATIAFAEVETKPIKVGIMLGQPPFSYEVAPHEYDGLAIKMWELVAKDLNLKYEYIVLDTTYNGLVQATYDKKVDVVVAPLSVTYKRLQFIDYARPYFMNNIGLAISSKEKSNYELYWMTFLKFFKLIAYGVCIYALVLGPSLWFAEKSLYPNDPEKNSSSHLLNCIWGASGVFMGHRFYNPESRVGKVMVNVALFVSVIFFLGLLSFELASGVQLSSNATKLSSLSDLNGKVVAVEKGSFVVDVAKGLGSSPMAVNNTLDGLKMTSNGDVFGFMGDFFIMQYMYDKNGIPNVEMSPFNIANDEYAFAFSKDNPLKGLIDESLIKLQHNDMAADVCTRFLGKLYRSNCAF